MIEAFVVIALLILLIQWLDSKPQHPTPRPHEFDQRGGWLDKR